MKLRFQSIIIFIDGSLQCFFIIILFWLLHLQQKKKKVKGRKRIKWIYLSSNKNDQNVNQQHLINRHYPDVWLQEIFTRHKWLQISGLLPQILAFQPLSTRWFYFKVFYFYQIVPHQSTELFHQNKLLKFKWMLFIQLKCFLSASYSTLALSHEFLF